MGIISEIVPRPPGATLIYNEILMVFIIDFNRININSRARARVSDPSDKSAIEKTSLIPLLTLRPRERSRSCVEGAARV